MPKRRKKNLKPSFSISICHLQNGNAIRKMCECFIRLTPTWLLPLSSSFNRISVTDLYFRKYVRSTFRSCLCTFCVLELSVPSPILRLRSVQTGSCDKFKFVKKKNVNFGCLDSCVRYSYRRTSLISFF